MIINLSKGQLPNPKTNDVLSHGSLLLKFMVYFIKREIKYWTDSNKLSHLVSIDNLFNYVQKRHKTYCRSLDILQIQSLKVIIKLLIKCEGLNLFLFVPEIDVISVVYILTVE